MNIGVRVSFLISTFVFSKCGPEGGIGSSIFSFLKDLHFVFHSGCIDLHPHQHVQGFSFLHILSKLFVNFLMMVILTHVISHCDFDLHFSNSYVEHLFMCL